MPGELVLQALRHVWLSLRSLNVPAAVIGGMALAAWKHVRATKDVDLLVGIDPKDLDSVLRGLSAAGMRAKRTPPVTSLGQLKIVQLLYEPPEAMMDLQVDLLLADSAYHRLALERSVSTVLPELDLEVSVLACEDLDLAQAVGRPDDRSGRRRGPLAGESGWPGPRLSEPLGGHIGGQRGSGRCVGGGFLRRAVMATVKVRTSRTKALTLTLSRRERGLD